MVREVLNILAALAKRLSPMSIPATIFSHSDRFILLREVTEVRESIRRYQLGVESSCVSDLSDHEVTPVVDQTTGVWSSN